jgi:hypothetical protein
VNGDEAHAHAHAIERNALCDANDSFRFGFRKFPSNKTQTRIKDISFFSSPHPLSSPFFTAHNSPFVSKFQNYFVFLRFSLLNNTFLKYDYLPRNFDFCLETLSDRNGGRTPNSANSNLPTSVVFLASTEEVCRSLSNLNSIITVPTGGTKTTALSWKP